MWGLLERGGGPSQDFSKVEMHPAEAESRIQKGKSHTCDVGLQVAEALKECPGERWAMEYGGVCVGVSSHQLLKAKEIGALKSSLTRERPRCRIKSILASVLKN